MGFAGELSAEVAAKRDGDCVFLTLRREQHKQRGEDTTKQASKAKNKTIELLQMTRKMQRRDEILTRERHGCTAPCEEPTRLEQPGRPAGI